MLAVFVQCIVSLRNFLLVLIYYVEGLVRFVCNLRLRITHLSEKHGLTDSKRLNILSGGFDKQQRGPLIILTSSNF